MSAAAAAAHTLRALLAAAALAGPVAATTLQYDWETIERPPPRDPWRIGEAPPTPAAFLAEADGDADARFEGVDVASIDLSATAGALRTRALGQGRGTLAPSPLESTVFPDDAPAAAPLQRHAVDLAFAPAPEGSEGRGDPPPATLLEAPETPPPWAIEAPSVLFEVLRSAPPEVADQARLGLRDPVTAGLAARAAHAAALPDWEADVRARPDADVLAAAAARRGAASDPEAVQTARFVVIGFGLLGGLAGVTLVYVVMRSIFSGPRTLRSRRFG